MPAAFPSGIPGSGDEIEIAMQQAPQPDRHSMFLKYYISKILEAVIYQQEFRIQNSGVRINRK
jgi:hypothetical protein